MTSIDSLQLIDIPLQRWAQSHGGREAQYPVLMPESTLRQAGYHEAFPHLMMTAAVCSNPAVANARVQSSGWCLSPAVCYHAYAALQSQTIQQGVKISARGHCFRNEEASQLIAGRRQIEFQMRELVLIGSAPWIDQHLVGLAEEISALALQHGLEGSWQPASDPFFLPTSQGKAHLQKLLGTKLEYCLPDGLSISSINRHRDFFGSRFDISLPDGGRAHSACVAFGLDRWASQATNAEPSA